MSATVTLTDMNGKERTNKWPRSGAVPNPAGQGDE